MAHVLSSLLPDGRTLRAALALGGYAGLLYGVACGLILMPGQALAKTGYSRVMTVAQYNAMNAARYGAQAAAAASAIAAAPSGTSVAVRAITAAAGGWPAIGVAAGIIIAQMYFNQQQVQAIKDAAAPAGDVMINGQPMPAGTQLFDCPGSSQCQWFYEEYITVPTPHPGEEGVGCDVSMAGPVPNGWAGWYSNQTPETCLAYRAASNPNNQASQEPSVATPSDIQDYWTDNPTGANSPASNTSPVGAGNQPTAADTVVSDPVSTSDAQTTVVPSTAIPDGATVIDPDATPPSGTQTTSTTDQQTTTTTTTSTNPDGSTTTQEDSSTTVQCSTGDHELRTFGTILEEHIAVWRGSGIAGQLALLQSLTWPSDLPTISLSSTLFGNFSVNFNDWSAMFLALRAIVIAGAGFAAYRIIFVGNG